jgi:hypothetical protein
MLQHRGLISATYLLSLLSLQIACRGRVGSYRHGANNCHPIKKALREEGV